MATWNFFDSIAPLPAVEADLLKELEDLITVVSMAPLHGIRQVDTRPYAELHGGLARWDLSTTPTIPELESDIVRFYKRRKTAPMPPIGTLITFVPEATGGGHSMLTEGITPTVHTTTATTNSSSSSSSSSSSLTDNLIDRLVAFLVKFKRTR